MTTTISTDQVKELRAQTGISVMQCKSALEEAGGDMDKALAILKEKSGAIALKKAGRTLGSGTVSTYVHGGGRVGVMLELLCETDFVSKNEEFVALAREIAMQIAAMGPESDEEREVLMEQPFIKDSSKTVASLIEEAIQKFGERTEIGRFVRYQM